MYKFLFCFFFSGSENFRDSGESNMCFEKKVAGLIIECPKEKSCMKEFCVKEVIEACKGAEDLANKKESDLSWAML